MYPMLFKKGGTSSLLTNNNLSASPPLILGFHPSKRHAALIASCDQGSVILAFYLGITRTEAFFMASNASYPDVRSMAFSRSIMLLLLIIYEYHVISVQVMFQSYANSCCIELVARRQHLASFLSSRSNLLRFVLIL